MNLQVIIPAGQTEMTVNGLHQWDYGRKLDIHAPDLPAIVEVHFACPGMDEAVVRVGSAASGAVTVAIPDRCLEQSSPITAWVYEVGEISGQTIKTLTLNITARKRPQTTGSIDPENSDKYTEAVGAMNEAVATLQNGDIKAKEADHATEADHAANLAVFAPHTTQEFMEFLHNVNNESKTFSFTTNSAGEGIALINNYGTENEETVCTIPAYARGTLTRTKDSALNLVDNHGKHFTAYYALPLKTWVYKYDEADKANKIKTIVITSYEDLMSYIPQYPNDGVDSYAIANNGHTITLSNDTVIPPWSSGMLVVDGDASLTLTCFDGSIISAYFNFADTTWRAKKLSGVSIVGSDNKVTAPGLYAVTLRHLSSYTTHMLSIVNLDERATSTSEINGHYAYYVPVSRTIVSNNEVDTFVDVAVCIAKYDF